MFEFLQTPEGKNVTAFVTFLIIMAALALGSHPFKQKNLPVCTTDNNRLDLWVARDYFMYVNSLVMAANNLKDLQATMPLIEGFYKKQFRVRLSSAKRRSYYNRLLEEYYQKELGFDMLPIELCPN